MPERYKKAPEMFPAVFFSDYWIGRRKKPPYILVAPVGKKSSCVCLLFPGNRSIPEKQGNAPQGSQGNDRIHDPASPSVLPAEDSGYQVELENTNGAPVEAADNCQQQCKFIQHLNPSFLNRE